MPHLRKPDYAAIAKDGLPLDQLHRLTPADVEAIGQIRVTEIERLKSVCFQLEQKAGLNSFAANLGKDAMLSSYETVSDEALRRQLIEAYHALWSYHTDCLRNSFHELTAIARKKREVMPYLVTGLCAAGTAVVSVYFGWLAVFASTFIAGLVVAEVTVSRANRATGLIQLAQEAYGELYGWDCSDDVNRAIFRFREALRKNSYR